VRPKNSKKHNLAIWDKITLTEGEKGYLAGMLDGDGGISLSLKKDKRHLNQMVATIQYTNTSKEMLDWIQNKLQGVGCIHVSNKKTKKSKEGYSYMIWTPVIIEKLLFTLLPYLIIKKEQAKIMIDYLKNRPNRQKKRRRNTKGQISGHSPIPEFSYSCYMKLKKLNKRGV